jgi:hypothetical protein
MFFGTAQPFESWMAVYALYILWAAGLGTFYLLTTMKRSEVVDLESPDLLMTLPIAWGITSALGAVSAWPLLITIPVLIVSIGAPWSAGVISFIFMCTNFYLGGRLIQQRFLVHIA